MRPPVVKRVRTRRLRDGSYVAVAHGAAPLVVDERTALALERSSADQYQLIDVSLQAFLDESDFTSNEGDEGDAPPASPSSRTSRVVSVSLGVAALLLAITGCALFFHLGLPSYRSLVPSNVNPAGAVVTALVVAIATAIPHELAHVVFGRTRRFRQRGLSFQILKGTATTNLTHVWAWTTPHRMAATGAGLVVDLAFLTFFMAATVFSTHWSLEVASAVMVLRILWQLRIHRNCDGRHMLKMLLDDPLLTSNVAASGARSWKSGRPIRHRIWALATICGITIEAAIILVWIGPALLLVAGIL